MRSRICFVLLLACFFATACSASEVGYAVGPKEFLGLSEACSPVGGEGPMGIPPGHIVLEAGEAIEIVDFVVSSSIADYSVGLATSGFYPGDFRPVDSEQDMLFSPSFPLEGPGEWVIVIVVRSLDDPGLIELQQVNYRLDGATYRNDKSFQFTLEETCF